MQYFTNLIYGSPVESKTETQIVTPDATVDTSNGAVGGALQLEQKGLIKCVKPTAADSLYRCSASNEVKFNKKCAFEISKLPDTFDQQFLHVRLGKAPEGWIWKKNWPMYFLKSCMLEIGGSTIYEDTAESIQILCSSSNIDNENMFRFEAVERTERSQRPVETCIPITSMRIDLWRMKCHFVRFIVEIASFDDIAERVGGGPGLANEDSLIETCQINGVSRLMSLEMKDEILAKWRKDVPQMSISASNSSSIVSNESKGFSHGINSPVGDTNTNPMIAAYGTTGYNSPYVGQPYQIKDKVYKRTDSAGEPKSFIAEYIECMRQGTIIRVTSTEEHDVNRITETTHFTGVGTTNSSTENISFPLAVDSDDFIKMEQCIRYFTTMKYPVVLTNGATRSQIKCEQALYATDAYVWIRNKDKSSLKPIVKTISVITDGLVRWRTSGYQAREEQDRCNVYAISYGTGIVEDNGFEHCLGLFSLDSYMFEIEWETDAPAEVDVVIVHRVQNIFVTQRGMGGTLISR